ncbi:hypothetical protein BVG16_14990 [Paenibacillus selenitireducens]|uniref:Uncharacterized protein n=1 Tax=Paenibacillus selenitireducens TaxID=1324314 RepID=A0A1T2XD37_9BACL|nr:DUF6886 family protein [Paenibacillus selenitireducens]OPA77738.1 hypothetical protein BVG16_14990 [Paenibacillus selenitireducens]
MLFHFSEDPHIEEFMPRRNAKQEDSTPFVWAIDPEHAVHYYFPRDCPRVIYSRSESAVEDEAQFFAHSQADKIIWVESSWEQIIQQTTIYKYVFKRETFEVHDPVAGYYVSREPVTPIHVQPMDNLVNKILASGVDLRFTPNLYPIRNAVLNSSLHDFSIIRFQHATAEQVHL